MEIDLHKTIAEIADVATVPSHYELWPQSDMIIMGECLDV
jgi:hypothetical protein